MWAPGYEYLESVLKTKRGTYWSVKDNGYSSIFLHEDLNFVDKQHWHSSNNIEREFKVGLLANNYNSPYLVKTIGYYSECQDGATCQHILTEYVQGVELNELKSRHRTQLLYLQILYMIRHLQGQMEFTHYDLHDGNIIVQVNTDNTIKHFTFDGEHHTLETPYDIKFIDLMMAHVRGIPSMYFFGFCDRRYCPGVFDPLSDYGNILSLVIKASKDGNIIDDRTLTEMLDKNLLISNMRNGPIGRPIMEKFCLLESISCIPTSWACVETTITKTRKEVNLEAAMTFLSEFGVEDLQGLSPEIYVNRYLRGETKSQTDINEKYIILMGEAHVYEKKQQMAQRQSTVQEFFEELVAFVKRSIPG